MKKPLLLFFYTGCFISCHKDQGQPADSWTWFGTNNASVYNYVLINANQVGNKSDSSDFHIGVTAAFIDSSNHHITGINKLSVNDLAIAPGYDSTFNYDYGAASDIDQGLALFGSNVNITIRGNSVFDTVSRMIYVPKKLQRLANDFADSVSHEDGLMLHWAPDQDNTWGNVQIQLFYYSGLSLKADSSLPEKIQTVNITTADNGLYRLTSLDLKPFPVKSFIGISIARGTQDQALLPVSHKRIYFFSSSSLSSTPLRVVQ